MDNDRLLGALIIVAVILAGVLYFGSFWIPWWSFLAAVKVLISIAFLAVLGIGGWIGWTMASTPSPGDVDDIDLDEDFEEDFEEDLEEEPSEAEEEGN